jgi:predicted DNA-binding transcriptional regulator AlpA
MAQHSATRDILQAFFNVRSDRSVPVILRGLGITCPGRKVPWALVWTALGLSPDQDPQHHGELTAPLMTAREVADDLGVDPETVYRWVRERRPDMPPAILIGQRRMRWRKSEIRAWQGLRAMPSYPKRNLPNKPVFGALAPRPGH